MNDGSMKNGVFAEVLVCVLCAMTAAVVAARDNLITGGDMSVSEKDFPALVRTNGGKATLACEEWTWNRFGRIAISAATTNVAKGFVTHAASAIVGRCEKGAPGFVVKPNTKYRYSIEIRGKAPKCSISALEWKQGADRWDSSCKLLVAPKPQAQFSTYGGTFTTGAETKYAALQVQLWSSTQYSIPQCAVGDYIDFDNVVVEESSQTIESILSGNAGKPVVKVKSALAASSRKDAELYSDFRRIRSPGDPDCKFRFSVIALPEAFEIHAAVEDKGGFSQGEPSRAWTGDTMEIFFAPPAGCTDRSYSQFAFNPAGGRFTGRGSDDAVSDSSWTLKTGVAGTEWKVHVTIPYSTLGYREPPVDGEVIGFNIGRTRVKDRDNLVWADVKEYFAESERFGRLVVRDWNKGLKAFRDDAPVCRTRAEFERLAQEGEKAKNDAVFAQFKGRKFVVAPVPVSSDWSGPFLPPQIFNPPSQIKFRAAVNEIVALPIAVANLTDKTATYRVIVETVPEPSAQNFNKSWYNGTWGLAGFPEKQVAFRHAVEFRDSDNDESSRRLDPLPRMDESCTIVVAPKEAGVAWFDFDTKGVPPRTYSGRLRVIPLNEKAEFKEKGWGCRDYVKGGMTDVPVSLEVLPFELDNDPALPMGFFQDSGGDKETFKMMIDCGMRECGVSPYDFRFGWKKGQGFDTDVWKEVTTNRLAAIRQELVWAKEYGVRLTWHVCFRSYQACMSMVPKDEDQNRKLEFYCQYVAGIKKLMNSCGIADADYLVETFDEPRLWMKDEVLGIHKATKRACPTVRLALVFGMPVTPIEHLREYAPYVDAVVLYDHGHFEGDDRVKSIRELQARGIRVSHYTCYVTPRVSLAAVYRGNAWFGERYGLNANNFFWFSDCAGGLGQFDFKFITEGSISYRSFGRVMPSIRYMSMRQGMDDMRYLAAYRRLAGDTPETRRVIADAVRRVCVEYAHDVTMPDKVRNEIIERILRLKQ